MLATAHRRLVLAAYVSVMLAALLLPVPPTPDYTPRGFDKLVHVGLFFGFAVVAVWATVGAAWRRLATVLLAAVALAGLTEVAQALVGYRTGDVLDFAAGAAGAAVGCVMASGASAMRRRT